MFLIVNIVFSSGHGKNPATKISTTLLVFTTTVLTKTSLVKCEHN